MYIREIKYLFKINQSFYFVMYIIATQIIKLQSICSVFIKTSAIIATCLSIKIQLLRTHNLSRIIENFYHLHSSLAYIIIRIYTYSLFFYKFV